MRGDVYALSCEPYSKKYYIGATICPLKKRLEHHLHDARVKRRNIRKIEWIRSIQQAGLSVSIESLECIEAETKEELRIALSESERYFIFLFKKCGLELLNEGNGGFRNEGRIVPQSQRERLSKINKGQIVTQEQRIDLMIKCAKLKPYEVVAIREMFSNGMSKEKIASHFGVARHTVRDIVNNKTWKFPFTEEQLALR